MATCDPKAAAAADSLVTETAVWSIPARGFNEVDECAEFLESMAYSSMQLGGQELQLAIKPSTEWGPEDMSRLSSLVASRNRFVCMQLVTMVKEQHKKVTTAMAAGDTTVLHQAKFVFLGTITAAAADTGAPTVVSAGLFYPRWCSKDGAEMPHMYVELLCCNSPGRSYGSILLSHIEQFTAAGADYLSAAFASCSGAPSAADVANSIRSGCAAGSVETTAAAAVAGSAVVPAALAMPVVLPLLAEGVAVPADPLSSCCTACGSTADGSASSASSAGMQLLVAPAELSCATSAVSAPGGCVPCSNQPSQQPHLVPVVPTASMSLPDAAGAGAISGPTQTAIISAAAPVAAAAAAVPAAKRIRGVKLLSVESARSFYERHGYGQPDACREMFKPLLLLPPRDVAGSASSSSICSMMSVSSSSSNTVC
uniref:Uncharacterized protein n=1 Tax=Tetradesmus obliquus TaxID=3088 RepID=A0A383WH71_TETOB|eukprot:jgi/Sobl393_1/17382/SZX76835.1